MNMYEKYIKERENLDCIKTDKGFITYRVDFPNCFIANYFVLPEYRMEGHSVFLADQVFDICRQADVEKVFCKTDERTIGWKISRNSILSYGFKEIEKDGPVCTYSMGVKNG